jgi:hypothetical protein
MDTDRFDLLSRTVARVLPRRSVAGILGVSALVLPGLVDAGKKKRKKKVKRNEFGCVNVGRFCKRDDQCCSGICDGKQGKKRCRAHHSGDCQAGQDACAGSLVPCTTATGDAGFCVRTTGNAGYCSFSGRCTTPACQKDADCQDLCGPQAACIVCDGDCHSGRTVCVGPSNDSCEMP